MIEPFAHLASLYTEGNRVEVETRVLSSPYGAPHQRVPAPYSEGQLQALLKLIERPALTSAQLRAEWPALQELGWVQGEQLALSRARALEQIGQRLYETLFPRGRVRTALNVSLSQARKARQPLPFQLQFDREAGYLARLPWELLRDEQGYLVRNGRLALARYIAFKSPLTALLVRGPLRVLVVISRPRGLAALDRDGELAALRESLGSLSAQEGLRVDVLERATWRGLVEALSSGTYHIIHFDGHGDFGRRCPQCRRLAPLDELTCTGRGERGALCGQPLAGVPAQGYLAFERQDGEVDWRSAENLAAALFRNPETRLAVLSACRSAMVGGGAVFAGTAPALIGMGVPAVAAMQFEVPLYATVAFTEVFYGAVAQRRPLIDAMAEARTALDDDCWYRPTLYLRGHGDPRGVLFGSES